MEELEETKKSTHASARDILLAKVNYDNKREDYANKVDKEIRDTIHNLSDWSDKIDLYLNEARQLISKQVQNNTIYDLRESQYINEQISDLTTKINIKISMIENSLIELKVLDNKKALIAEPLYQEKIANWRNDLKNIETTSGNINQIQNISQETNPDDLKIKLTNIGIAIDANIKSICSRNKKIKAVLSSYESGLVILKNINPQDPIIAHLDNKLQEWKAKVKRARITRNLIVILIILLIALRFIINS